jgi:hypothetical protein
METDAAVDRSATFNSCPQRLGKACWLFTQFPQARRRLNNKQQNRTDHLLQKPDIFTCYRHNVDTVMRFGYSASASMRTDN